MLDIYFSVFSTLFIRRLNSKNVATLLSLRGAVGNTSFLLEQLQNEMGELLPTKITSSLATLFNPCKIKQTEWWA